jgi:hypothetical protein
MATCEARWEGPRARGEALQSAISADDPGDFEIELNEIDENNVELIIRVSGENLRTMQVTMDDLLACLAAAETSLDAVQD